jgi:hypothetical protein
LPLWKLHLIFRWNRKHLLPSSRMISHVWWSSPVCNSMTSSLKGSLSHHLQPSLKWPI